MMDSAMRSVTVRVPATSANLGPGFDTLGLAFSLYNFFTFSLAEHTSVEGCEPRFSGEDNLALVAFRAACAEAGVPSPCVRLSVRTDVPVSRGLGSSATFLVGGVMGARALLDLSLSDDDLLQLVNRLEGHPDNVAPALLGGLRASLQQDGVAYSRRLALHGSLRFCALIPSYETPTSEARAVLPREVPFSDAIFNVTHATVLTAALAEGDVRLLGVALDDRLHQPYRRTLMPEYDEVRATALALGAHAFFISGSGSTLMAVYTDEEFVGRMRAVLSDRPAEWQVLPLTPDPLGATVL